MKRTSISTKRKAVAGIVAATILFAMLFTVGTGFFLFANNMNLLYSAALTTRGAAIQGQINENLLVTTLLTAGHIGLYLNNTGGIAVNITSIFVTDFSGNVVKCLGKVTPAGCSNSSPALPLPVNPSASTSVIDTLYTYTSGTNIVKVVTERGSVFSAVYPPAPSSVVTQALAAGAFGNLYLSFLSYTYYSVTSCAPNYCITKQGPAFQLPASFVTGNNVAFAIRITNVSPNKANITLDKYTNILDFWPVGSSFRTANLYLVSNSSNTLQALTPLVLFYNTPVVLVFASATPGTVTPTGFTGSSAPAAGTIASIHIVSHGWLGVSYSKITGASPPLGNYGQDSPFVSTLYS